MAIFEIQKEFDSILTSRNVVNKLNELEGLVSEAELRRDEAGLPDQDNMPTPYVHLACILLRLYAVDFPNPRYLTYFAPLNYRG
jgi:hypothetical protein